MDLRNSAIETLAFPMLYPNGEVGWSPKSEGSKEGLVSVSAVLIAEFEIHSCSI